MNIETSTLDYEVVYLLSWYHSYNLVNRYEAA